MITKTTEVEKIEFHGGLFGLVSPFIVLFIGIIILALTGNALPMAFWVPTLASVLLAILLAKRPQQCAEFFIKGMSSEMIAIMVMAWFLAGIVAQLLKETGLIQGLIWLSLSVGLKGTFFPFITFIIGSLLSTATGTAIGTVIALSPILYPVGVALGANPPVMLAAIISAAYFGDNIAPVSDTTIASAYTQGVDVPIVVRSRLKYAFAAAAIAAVFFIIFGGSGTETQTDLSFLGELSPKGLIMLIVPAVLIIMMYKRVHLIVALMSSGTFGLIVGLVTGLLDPARLLVIDMNTFTVGGVIVEGMMNLIDIAVFAMLLMGLIHLLEKGGFFDALIQKLTRFTKTPRSSEFTISLITILLNVLTVANSVVIVMEGPIAKDILVGKHHITPDRSANILDSISAATMCLVPYGFAPLLAYMFAGGSGAPVDFSLLTVIAYTFHGWSLLLVMFFSIYTGWGRTYNDTTTSKTKIPIMK